MIRGHSRTIPRLAALCGALGSPAFAQDDLSLSERIEALRAPRIVIEEPYADEIAQDIDRIAREGAALFGPEAARIVLFVGPDCAECDAVRAEFDALTDRLSVESRVLDIAKPETAALLRRLTLDTVPSYVMEDRLIRGAMPAFVLERYLTE